MEGCLLPEVGVGLGVGAGGQEEIAKVAAGELVFCPDA